jgi:RNA polymerase sigma-70 factor (ECF subfamily)
MVRRPPSLIDAARRGDSEALAGLWREYQAPLLRYLRTRRCQAPEDVASQVWIDVSSSIHRFEGDADDFRRWFFTIAHRRSVDEIRRSVRRDGVAIRVADTVVAATTDEDHDGVHALDRAIALVASLPDSQAEAVMLRIVHDLPAADVAAILGTTEGNVRVLVHRGLERLRRKIRVTDATPAAMHHSS